MIEGWKRRMNLGCGTIQPDGWINVDRSAHATNGVTALPWEMDEFPDAQVLADVTVHLPFDDDSIDLVVMNHSLQQVPQPELHGALSRIRRVLRVDGVLRISVPDIAGAIRAWQHSDVKWFPNRTPGETLDETFTHYLTWYGTNVTPFTEASLGAALVRAGFRLCIAVELGESRMAPFESGVCDLDDRRNESTFVEALK